MTLRFAALNDNDAGVVFGDMSRAEIAALQVSEEEWRRRVVGLQPKADITQWHVIRFAYKELERGLLLGFRVDTGESWCTSQVMAVSPDQSALITHSGSLYELAEPGFEKGEPGLALTLHLVWTLRCWGAGVIVRHFPEVFY